MTIQASAPGPDFLADLEIPTLPEQVHAIIAGSEWSRAERRMLPQIEDEVITYLADGEGNRFIAQYCEYRVIPMLRAVRKVFAPGQ